jgi:RHS repeat-associated protein
MNPPAGLLVYFGGKLVGNGLPGSMYPIVLDRLGSGVKTFPYGEEKVATGWDGLKFATYARETATNLDYADQRYYSSSIGRFMSADPAAPGDTSSPSSWNYYGYVEGDPINLNDPEGLDCASTPFYFNGKYQGTVGSIMGKDSDVSILATAMYTESGHGRRVDVAAEEYAIGAVIMNRWQFVNQNWYLSSSQGGQSLNVSGWGTRGDSISSIVKNPSQFAIYANNADGNLSLSDGNLSLSASAQRSLDRGFNSFNPPHASAPYEQKAGSFGDANVFYGVPDSFVSETRVAPPRRRRPAPPRRRPRQ